MRPSKQAIDISFAKGLDTKTDPKRVQIGNFLQLENTIFDKGGQLQKRNGYTMKTALPNSSFKYLTTYNSALTALGSSVTAYSESNEKWVSKGVIEPVTLSTAAVLRNNLNQTACDAVIAPNGFMCTAFLESNGSTTTNKYQITDSVTGQNIIAPVAIPVSSGTVSGGMRVFYLGNNFIIVFTNTITGTAHLQYITINAAMPTIVGANTDIAAAYITATTLSWDGVVVDSRLYIAYNLTSGGQAIKIATLSTTLVLSTATTFVGAKATMMSVCADTTNAAAPVIYITYYDLSATKGYVAAVDANLNKLFNPVIIITSGTILNIASAAQNGVCKTFAEVSNAYSWTSAIKANFIEVLTITPTFRTFSSTFSAGAGAITVSSATGLTNGMYLVDNTTAANITAETTFTVAGTTLTLSINTAGNSAAAPGDTLTAIANAGAGTTLRSVGLASKAFIYEGTIYFLAVYDSPYQSTFFLVDGSNSSSSSPKVAAKLASGNAGGYLTLGLPSVTLTDNLAQIPYLFKDSISAVNKNTDVAAGTQVAGIYSQIGINLVNLTITTTKIDTAEIGKDLHISGGQLWMYDGQFPVEHGFFFWPDVDTATPANTATWSAIGGNMVAKPDGSTNTNAYYYQFTYEWTDNQGNAFRSAPSIPIPVTTTGALSTGSVVLNIPTLRVTYKVPSAVKIVIYRWSVAQQVYYQVTSISTPTLNSTTTDTITYTDTLADASILGNNILYTTGGVAENIAAPATNIMTLFDTRLWLVDAEDPNLLWFSKQVIEQTPVEMTDLFTLYVAPTIGAQGSTGPITALSVMDDKLIIFKKNAIYYVNGTGPDNTGANNQYSEPIFITATVGCSNQQSIVFMPQGLLFQSDKGIWLLDRGLNTSYIGAPVQSYNDGIVESAQNIPATNQVRFILDTGITLMYDYYYAQWGTFKGVPALSSTIYQDLHTFINSSGQVFQENPGSYVDGSRPVLMSFRTGPIRLGDLQNYQRTFFYYLLGTYISPHKLVVTNYYDYSDTPQDSRVIRPTNYVAAYGAVGPYGQNEYGGASALEDWRIFANRKCMALGIGIQEVYDSSFGVPAGAGFTLSGLSVVCGFKSPFRTQSAANSAG